MRSHIIGVAGASGSGKTELACRLAAAIPGSAIVTLDSYYRDLPGVPFEQREKMNFDHPDALDWELLREHLVALSEGRGFDEPIYSFARHERTSETRRIEPSEVLIVEGLFVLYWPEVREILDTSVFVQTNPEVCFQRRLRRDVAERGRTPESVFEQYELTVRPGAEQFVYPTAKYAGMVVSGETPIHLSTSAVLAQTGHSRAHFATA